jgi:hypothetical protein
MISRQASEHKSRNKDTIGHDGCHHKNNDSSQKFRKASDTRILDGDEKW